MRYVFFSPNTIVILNVTLIINYERENLVFQESMTIEINIRD